MRNVSRLVSSHQLSNSSGLVSLEFQCVAVKPCKNGCQSPKKGKPNLFDLEALDLVQKWSKQGTPELAVPQFTSNLYPGIKILRDKKKLQRYCYSTRCAVSHHDGAVRHSFGNCTLRSVVTPCEAPPYPSLWAIPDGRN